MNPEDTTTTEQPLASVKLAQPDDTTPVLRAYRIIGGDPNEFVVWCDECQTYHCHSGEKLETALQHRQAHCRRDLGAGYDDYFGEYAGEITLAEVQQAERAAYRRERTYWRRKYRPTR